MNDPIDQEIEAIKVVLQVLEPLSHPVRQSVFEYVAKRLGISVAGLSGQGDSADRHLGRLALPNATKVDGQMRPPHIKELKEQKIPRSANEMAALVAYYLANIADEKKATVTTKDMETYFKIAEFRLPEQIRVTLPNAKTAGYFDATGNGEYRLNAVGYNLVVHSMPRGSSADSPRRKSGGGKNRS